MLSCCGRKSMKKLVAVIDMQNDFICGALSNSDTEKILPAVAEYIKRADEQGAEIVFTRDTHDENYAQTQEGRKLPVPHCVKNTKGWQIAEALSDYVQNVFDKYTFGSLLLAQYALDNQFDCIDLVGVCTDICVISNALLLKAFLPEAEINVVESCCAGVTPERHRNAIEAMRACQINII